MEESQQLERVVDAIFERVDAEYFLAFNSLVELIKKEERCQTTESSS